MTSEHHKDSRKDPDAGRPEGWMSNLSQRMNQFREDFFDRFREGYGRTLETFLAHPAFGIVGTAVPIVISLGLLYTVGTDFFLQWTLD